MQQLIPASVLPHVRRFGFSGLIALTIVILMLAGINPVSVLTGETAAPPALTSITGVPAETAGRAELASYARIINAEHDDYWRRAFRIASVPYAPPKFIVANSSGEFGCGMAGQALGTFYCRPERAVYVDLSAYERLAAEFGQAAHQAQAAIISYAFANHVQYLVDHFETNVNPTTPLPPVADETLRGQRLGMQAYCYLAVWVKTVGLRRLFDEPSFVRAFDAAIAMPAEARTRAAEAGIYKALPQPSIGDRSKWFSRGYDVPAPGTCKMRRIIEG